jgi:tetratricopeptide (TPR) repeat protein
MRFAYCRGLVPLLLFLAGALWAGPSARPVVEVPTGAVIYRQLLAATVWVHAPDQGKGTGWLLDTSRRWLITDYHVVGENDTVEVVFPFAESGVTSVITERSWYVENLPRLRQNGLAVRGRVLRRSRQTDLALIELSSLPSNVKALRLARSETRPGERVHLVGNRYDCPTLWTYATGSVRQARTLREGYFNGGRQLAKGTRVLVAQMPINEGDSGAALANSRGEVVGVAAAVAWEAQGSGLFIDVSAVRELAALPFEEPGSSPVHALPSARLAPQEIYARGLRSLLLVQAPHSDRHASGWLLDRSRRLAITTSEAVGKHKTVDVAAPVFQDGRVVAETAFYRQHDRLLRQKKARVEGVVLARDERRNLALLELESVPDGTIEARFATVPPVPGDGLHALSNPRGMDALWAYTSANVRQLGRINLDQTMDKPDPAVVLVQASLSEGDAGGLLLNDNGELVGVISGKSAPQQQVSYALALSEVKAFLAEKRPHWTPSTAPQFVERGVLFRKGRQYERALRDLNEAIRLDRRLAPAYGERAWVHHFLENDDRALADCDRALELDSKLVSAYCTRAEVRCRHNEWDRALTDCNMALRLDSHSAHAFSIRARIRLARGDTHNALADCDEAIWLDRELPAAHLIRGQVHARNGEHDKAIADYEQALRLDPRLAEAYRCRGDSHWINSDVRASLADYDEARKLNPKDALAWFGRGRALLARGEHERALTDFTRAMRLQRATVANVLTEIDRRTAELFQDEKDLPERSCELLRQGLLAVQPFVKDQAEITQAIAKGLDLAGREKDLRQRATLLRKTIVAVRRLPQG